MKTTADNAVYNMKSTDLQKKGGLECVLNYAEDGSHKIEVVVDDSYTFSKMIKPNLMEIVNEYDPAVPITDQQNRKISNYTCLIIKIMMNKANMNPGIKFRRIDWENVEEKIWSFKKYWEIKNPG